MGIEGASILGSGTLAAVVDLNKPPHYIHWGWFQISVANFIVIVLMVVVFVLAIALPFPGRRRP
jgi:large-conductance mechanosensitive channel